MAPQPLFGVSPSFLNKLLDVGSRESRDPVKGVKPGTLASMLNRYYNPQFGSSGSWLNPGQYEVLKKGGFNPSNPSIEKARAYYSTPEGQQELSRTAEQLGGVTDFRSTKYLRDTGNLLSYPTNLIPAVVQGERRFLTPQKLKELGATPDLSENTFFNERKRPSTKEWWKSLGSGTSIAADSNQRPATPDQRSVEDILSSSLGLKSKPSFDSVQQKSTSLLDLVKGAIVESLVPSMIFPF